MTYELLCVKCCLPVHRDGGCYRCRLVNAPVVRRRLHPAESVPDTRPRSEIGYVIPLGKEGPPTSEGGALSKSGKSDKQAPVLTTSHSSARLRDKSEIATSQAPRWKIMTDAPPTRTKKAKHQESSYKSQCSKKIGGCIISLTMPRVQMTRSS